MLRFGLPTVPADASVYALQVADRFYLCGTYSAPPPASTRSRSSSPPSCSWRCAASSTRGRRLPTRSRAMRRPARLYSLVTTYYALATGAVVCAVALLGRWMVRLLAAHRILRRLPCAAVARARLGAVRAVPGVCRDHRARARHLAQLSRRRRRSRRQRRAAARAGAAQRRRAGDRRRRHRAVRGLRGDAAVMYLLTRSLFKVGFEWLRLAKLAAILTVVAVSGELLLPTDGFAGLALRVIVARAGARRADPDALLSPPRARAGARALADGAGGWHVPRRPRRDRGVRRGSAERHLMASTARLHPEPGGHV